MLIKQLTRLIAKLLRLKTDGDFDAMDGVIYEALKTAGIDGQDSLTAKEKIGKIEDEGVLVSLHEALRVYLSVKMDMQLSSIDGWIVESLKGRKKLILDI